LDPMKQTAQELYTQIYDRRVPDWPGELEFYRELLASAGSLGKDVLEIACGTGRIALQLAMDGIRVTGLDLSTPMLAEARRKSAGFKNIAWVQGDMKDFDLGRRFGVIIIPGHSFQSMLTPGDQIACLECIRRHLSPGGLLVIHLDHQDFTWLAGLLGEKGGVFEPSTAVTHPLTGHRICMANAWTFEPSTQTATVRSKFEALNLEGRIVETWEMQPRAMHCVFRFEMEHLLLRAGFSVEASYGDFYKNPLSNRSEQMIWVARNRTS
jgi:SAM-dependent methyltransferase